MNRPKVSRPKKDSNGNLTSNDPTSTSNANQRSIHHDKTSAQLSSLSHLSSRLNVVDSYDPSSSIGGSVSGSVPRKAGGGGKDTRNKDKADRATIQQVLDPRTLVILFKMLQRGLISSVNGCVSTGKEANVYHASTPPPTSEDNLDFSNSSSSNVNQYSGSLALKIYKTSILVFKDRDRYVSGEFRFRHGYSRHNPRKMVRLWAEKEARNLKRLVSAGIRAPRPVELRDHVLVMDFLGEPEEEEPLTLPSSGDPIKKDGENPVEGGKEGGNSRGGGRAGWASPRLKDAEERIGQDPQRWKELYLEMLMNVRIMFWECRLVHADLSEYNVL